MNHSDFLLLEAHVEALPPRCGNVGGHPGSGASGPTQAEHNLSFLHRRAFPRGATAMVQTHLITGDQGLLLLTQRSQK
jgi:hypothetical protein